MRDDLFRLSVAPVLEVLLVLPEFIVLLGMRIRPMAAWLWAVLVAIAALPNLVCATVPSAGACDQSMPQALNEARPFLRLPPTGLHGAKNGPAISC